MIHITLTRDDLVAANACLDGLALFDAHYPNGLCGDWGAVRDKLIRSSLRVHLGWAARAVGLPMAWAGADLHDADLHDADLRRANLRRADLRWANLRWADLHDANLRWADLHDTDLRGADLTRAWLPASLTSEAARQKGARCDEVAP